VFLEYLQRHERFRAAAPHLRGGAAAYTPSFFAPYLLAAMLREWRRPAFVVAPSGEGSLHLAEELGVYLGCTVPVLPARGVLWGGTVLPAAHVCGERQRALQALQEGATVVVEAPALLERFPPFAMQPQPLRLASGACVAFDELPRRLVELGYGRVEQVRGRGEFAVRGGIVDVYPTAGEPTRAEFWGDEIESLRSFSVFSQRTIAALDKSTVHAAVEVDAAREDFQRALRRAMDAEPRGMVDGTAGTYGGRDEWGAVEGARDARDEGRATEELYRLAAVRATEALSAGFAAVGELAGSRPLAVLTPEEVWRDLADLAEEAQTLIRDEAERARFFLPLPEVRRFLDRSLKVETLRREQRWQFPAARPQLAARDAAAAERELGRLARDGYRVFLAFRHVGEAARAAYRMKSLAAQVREPGQDLPTAPGVYCVVARLREGFVSAELKLAVVGERALLRGAPRGPRFAAGTRLASFSDLRAGDFVVHEDHGVARFGGIQTKTVAGVTRDYLFLQFRGEDKVYLPHDQMGKVSRYIGVGGETPALNRLGGTAWQMVKTRARAAVAEMAGELLTLYSARRMAQGFAFPRDGELVNRVETGFPFEETEDQAEAIDDVKNDMEAASPMDRLVCGDVGYGKTEVALRAAAKAVEAGKQVLVLVPTTILAQQHAATFGERFSDLPVRVEMVSRFRSAPQTRQVLKEFAEGTVDILVGTHRLLSKDVTPSDLGLVILDEEQRFGVRQKELLRQLKLQVDAMSLSATPIPRTLQMSLTGIRDISVIETPPRGRHEIRTYIGEYRDDVARLAVEKELAREGQVFYLHNRVETIQEVAEHVRQLVPAARVLVAHGQMHEHELERVMTSFLSGEADVLVTTSIIESGIDIPSVNTLVVDRADLLGLAQLYQIRGRIGRSDTYAYAYLLYPSEELLTAEAVARLQTLSDHTELGAGFKIAMRDLEIRGAGNLLGDEQSGHVAAIGFELYAQLLEEAVAELRGQPLLEERVVRVEIPVTAYVPPEYISFEAIKIDAHRRIARARDVPGLAAVRAELHDRFGPPPEPVDALLRLQAVRIKAGQAGAAAVGYRGGRLSVDGLALDDAWAARLRASYPRAAYFKARAALTAHAPVELRRALGGGAAGRDGSSTSLLAWVEEVLDVILDTRLAEAAIPQKGIS
jgi:transcription-repair coupling factor (superfamily II helicase)